MWNTEATGSTDPITMEQNLKIRTGVANVHLQTRIEADVENTSNSIFLEMRMRSDQSVMIGPRSNVTQEHVTTPTWRAGSHAPRHTLWDCSHPRRLHGGAPGVRGRQRGRLEPHRKRHACSARQRNNQVSCLALALASSLTRIFVSPDQRPPTSLEAPRLADPSP